MEIGEFILKLVLSGSILLAMMVGVVWFMRKKGFIPYSPMNGTTSHRMMITSSLRLTPKAYLFAIRVREGKDILIGVTDRNISFVCDIGGDEQR